MFRSVDPRRSARLAAPGRGLRHKADSFRHLIIIAGQIFLFAALAASAFAPAGKAEDLRHSYKKQSISVRVIGRAAALPVSTFGANEESYIVELKPEGQGAPSLAKLLYRFLSYDRVLPAGFLDYELLHKFKATRRPECDEATDRLLYSLRSARSSGVVDREFSFDYARNATGIAIPQQAILPCYVTSPADDQGSSRSQSRPF